MLLFCSVDRRMGPPQWSDLGMFLLAAAVAFALALLIARRMQRGLLTALGSLTETANDIA